MLTDSGAEEHMTRLGVLPMDPELAMEALQQAVENARAGRELRTDPSDDGDDSGGELAGLSRDELYERAQQQGIAGRTKMSKRQLLEALGET